VSWVSSAASTVSTGIHDVAGAASNAWNSVAPAASSVVQSASGYVQSGANYVGSVLNQASQTISNGLSNAHTTLSDAVDRTANSIVTTATTCLEHICGAVAVTATIAVGAVGVAILTYRVAPKLGPIIGRLPPGLQQYAYPPLFSPAAVLAGAAVNSASYDWKEGYNATPYGAYEASGLGRYLDPLFKLASSPDPILHPLWKYAI
jgi:hypothetical protein